MIRAALVASLFLGCAPSVAELDELVAEARSCEAGDTCVLAGSSQCTCPRSVNQKRAAEVDELASRVACGGMMVECASPGTPVCENGSCVAKPL